MNANYLRRTREQTLIRYYDEWIATYKEGQVADVTLAKYLRLGRFLEEQGFSNLKIGSMTRRDYQSILNEYAKTREKQTVQDFHHQLKQVLKDAFMEGVIKIDVTYNAVIKGIPPAKKKPKFLSAEELKRLFSVLDLDGVINRDWIIYFIAKTGLRFAEALAVTPADFDFVNNTVNINKSWDYKSSVGKFQRTKTVSGNRTIDLDWQLAGRFFPLIKDLPPHEPFFVDVDARTYNSIFNKFIERKCREAEVPVISIHGLRHTHASVLLANGVSIYTVSARLGHAKVSITQDVYAHITDELARKDQHQITGFLSSL